MAKSWTRYKKEEPKEQPKEQPKQPAKMPLDETAIKAKIAAFSPSQPQNVIDGLYGVWHKVQDSVGKDTDLGIVYLLCKAYLMKHGGIFIVIGNDSKVLTSSVTGALQNERTLISFDDVGVKPHTDKFEWNFRAIYHPVKNRNAIRVDFKAVSDHPVDIFVVDAKDDIMSRVLPEAILGGIIGADTEIYIYNASKANVKEHIKALERKVFVAAETVVAEGKGLVRVKLPLGFELDMKTNSELEKLK